MIISDAHEFAFVHVPKCAGTSIRHELKTIDTTGMAFFPIADHPAMGRVHLAHLTLADLRDHFPETLAKVARYSSMAIVRDPVERFASAIFQRLREFKLLPQSAITPAVIDAEAQAVIAYLEHGPARLDLEHVHFNRQADFVELGGKRIVRDIFPVTRIAEAASHIRALTGVEIGDDRRNRTTELSFAPLRPVQRALRDRYARLVPADTRTRIRERMTSAGLYKEVAKERLVEPDSATDRFIRDYYARDFEIVAECDRSCLAAAV